MKTPGNISRIVAAAALAMIATSHSAQAAGGPTSVTIWNKYAVDAIVGIAKRPGAAATIDLTLVHTAIYDAVNAIDGVRHKPYASAPPAPSWASIDAAVAQSAHDVLVSLYPDQIATLDAQLASSTFAIPPGSGKGGRALRGSCRRRCPHDSAQQRRTQRSERRVHAGTRRRSLGADTAGVCRTSTTRRGFPAASTSVSR